MFFYVYVIQGKDRNQYSGYTENLVERLREHNRGLNPSTKPFRPWKVIYYEACLSESDAKRRERYLKTTQGRRLLQRRIKDYLYEQKV